MSHQTPSTKPHATPSASSQHTRLKDFSVESQRRTFIAEQERERRAAENRRSSRKITKAASGVRGAVERSGVMSRLDDDDSVGSCSVGSEESFYVGIERADYTSPDNVELYGEESKDVVEREDRLGIGRVNVNVWEKDFVPVHEEKSSLHQFMTGVSSGASKSNASKKDVLVAMPLVVNGIYYEQRNIIGEEDHSQVYQQEAAEGKMFINKLVGASSSAGDDTSTVAEMVNQSATTPAKRYNNTPYTTPGTQRTVRGGHYPVISPMALFSPYVGPISGEDNVTRQLREREIRKGASEEAKKHYDEKVKNLQQILDSLTVGGDGKLDAAALKEQMENVLKRTSCV